MSLAENPKLASFFDIYQADKPPSDFETTEPIPTLETVSPGMFIIASGSPRNGRYADYIHNPYPHSDLTQISLGSLQKQINIESIENGKLKEIAEVISNYEEPKSAWQINSQGEATDSQLSLGKARMTLAALALTHKLQNSTPITLISRDNNIGTGIGDKPFLDRPGYTIHFDPDVPGWTQAGRGIDPVEPIDQLVQIYRKSDWFFIANSTVMLRATLTPELDPHYLEQLINLDTTLPDDIQHQTIYSFLCIKPDKDKIQRLGEYDVFELVRYYSGFNVSQTGKLLYLIPGIVDWSREPYLSSSQVWQSESGFIHNSFSDLNESLNQQQGVWQPTKSVAEECPEVHDEMVGISTHSLDQLLSNF